MLPKLEQPTHSIQVPSLNKTYDFRPMLVKEERLLLIAKESDDENDSLKAVKQVLVNCALDPLFNIDALAIFDIEWVFIRLRAVSVSNIVDQEYDDIEDGKTYKLNVDLNQIIMPVVSGADRDIDLGNGMTLRLKYPPASIYGVKLEDDDALFACAEAIYAGDSITQIDNKTEFKAWFEELPISVSEKVSSFFENLPTMKLDIKYNNSLGKERKIELRTLSDFFDLR